MRLRDEHSFRDESIATLARIFVLNSVEIKTNDVDDRLPDLKRLQIAADLERILNDQILLRADARKGGVVGVAIGGLEIATAGKGA